jgi:DNA-binding MarR family transcriptional regulator
MKEIKINQNRDFKGVWIPKEIWLNQDLSWVEKAFLVEIHSLCDNEETDVSNSHFAEVFGYSKNRSSEIITKLIEKNYITRELIYEGKEIKKRIIRILP